jgi:predicted HTH domain antitoxin
MSNQLTIDLPVDITLQEARFLLAAKLFEIGRLSLGQAAELADYSKATFMELLGKVGIPVFDYPAEDLEKEMNL